MWVILKMEEDLSSVSGIRKRKLLFELEKEET